MRFRNLNGGKGIKVSGLRLGRSAVLGASPRAYFYYGPAPLFTAKP